MVNRIVLPVLVALTWLADARAAELPAALKNTIGSYVLDPADLITQAEAAQIFSGVTLEIMGTPTTRIVIWPTLEGEDALTFAKRLSSSWKFPTDFGYLLVVFPKQAKSALMVNSDAATNGFDEHQVATITQALDADLAAKRNGPGLHKAALEIMWAHEAADANRLGSPTSAKIVRSFGHHPLLFAVFVVVLLIFLWFFVVPTWRIIALRMRIRD